MATPAPPKTKDELERDFQNVLDYSIGVTAGAARLGISSWTLQKAVTVGELPAFKMGRDWRIWLTDLDAWASSR